MAQSEIEKRLDMLEATLLQERAYTDSRFGRLADRVHALEVKFPAMDQRIDALVADCVLLRKIVVGQTGISAGGDA